MPCRPVPDFHRFSGSIHAGDPQYSNGAPTHSRTPYTSAVPMHPNSSILASCPLRPARGCGRPAQVAAHTYQPPSGNSQKTAKSAIPHLAGHTPQPMPRRSPCALDPPYSHQAPKNPTLVSTRSAFPAPQIRHPLVSTNSLRRLLARYRMPGLGTKSAETRVRFTQACASNRLTRIPRSNDVGWSGVGGDASTSGGGELLGVCGLTRRPALELRPAWRRATAGRYLRVIFQVCVVLPRQACADGSVFFRRRLSKAGLSESTQHIRLILDPSPTLTYAVQSWAVFINMGSGKFR